MARGRLALLVLFAVVAGLAAYFYTSQTPQGASGNLASTAGATHDEGVAHQDGAEAEEDVDGDESEEAPSAAGTATPNALEDPAERRAAWEEIRAAIEEARTARLPQAPSGAAPSQARNADELGTLDESYIRDAIQEVVPLLAECYELAREEEPSLEGRLILEFAIGGEPEVGGVVEEVLIAEDSEIHHELLDECVRETIYTVALPAPEAGGRVDVTYPVTFAPGDEEEAPGEP